MHYITVIDQRKDLLSAIVAHHFKVLLLIVSKVKAKNP